MKPDLFVLGLLPLSIGIVCLFFTKWIKDVNLRFWQKYEPQVWGLEVNPARNVQIIKSISLWLIRTVGAALILIGVSIVDTAVSSH